MKKLTAIRNHYRAKNSEITKQINRAIAYMHADKHKQRRPQYKLILSTLLTNHKENDLKILALETAIHQLQEGINLTSVQVQAV